MGASAGTVFGTAPDPSVTPPRQKRPECIPFTGAPYLRQPCPAKVIGMEQTNDQRIAHALNILQKSLRSFVEERLRSEYGDQWLQGARRSLTDFRAAHAGDVHLDVQ